MVTASRSAERSWEAPGGPRSPGRDPGGRVSFVDATTLADGAAVLRAPAITASGDGAGRRPFHLLAKPTGATCNLDCEYCFFLSKEMLYPGSRFRMADELLETYIRQLIEAQPGDLVNVAWQGGEPTLMGVDFFRRATAYVERYRRPGMQVEYTIQTNGTLIDDELAAFFGEHDYLVGISIDGPPAMHDAYRVDRGGAPTSERVLRGLATLKRHGVEFNTLTTLHRANADHPLEVYRYLRDELGSRYLQLIPIIERLPAPRIDVPLEDLGLSPGLAREAPWRSWRDRPLYRQAGELVTDRSVTPAQYGRFLIEVFEEWVRHDIGTVYVQMFDVALANWHGEPGGLCVFQPTCGGALAMEHNGDVLLVRPLRRGGLPARQHHRDAAGRARRVRAPAPVRPGEARRAAAVLPRLRRAVRLPRGLSEGPLHPDAGRRARAQLPVRGLQGVLPPRGRADARDERAAAPGARAVGPDGRLRGARRGNPRGGGEGGSQRPVPVRQRPQDEALPRGRRVSRSGRPGQGSA